MKTIEVTLYKFDELSEQAKERAIQNHREKGYEDDFWGEERYSSYRKAEEIYNSLEAVEEEIYGSRLVAWIENNLSHLWRETNRISKHKNPQYGVLTKKRIKGNYHFINDHWSYKFDCIRYRVSRVFKTNNLEGCPLTGVCYDYDFLEPIIKFLKHPSGSVSNLDLVADMPTLESVANRDFEFRDSDEFIADELSSIDWDFTETGEMY